VTVADFYDALNNNNNNINKTKQKVILGKYLHTQPKKRRHPKKSGNRRIHENICVFFIEALKLEF